LEGLTNMHEALIDNVAALHIDWLNQWHEAHDPALAIQRLDYQPNVLMHMPDRYPEEAVLVYEVDVTDGEGGPTLVTVISRYGSHSLPGMIVQTFDTVSQPIYSSDEGFLNIP